MVKLKLVRGEDWEGLYADDTLFQESHILGGETYLDLINVYKEKLNGIYEVYSINQQWLEEYGGLPFHFDWLPLDKLELSYKSQ